MLLESDPSQFDVILHSRCKVMDESKQFSDQGIVDEENETESTRGQVIHATMPLESERMSEVDEQCDSNLTGDYPPQIVSTWHHTPGILSSRNYQPHINSNCDYSPRILPTCDYPARIWPSSDYPARILTTNDNPVKILSSRDHPARNVTTGDHSSRVVPTSDYPCGIDLAHASGSYQLSLQLKICLIEQWNAIKSELESADDESICGTVEMVQTKMNEEVLVRGCRAFMELEILTGIVCETGRWTRSRYSKIRKSIVSLLCDILKVSQKEPMLTQLCAQLQVFMLDSHHEIRKSLIKSVGKAVIEIQKNDMICPPVLIKYCLFGLEDKYEDVREVAHVTWNSVGRNQMKLIEVINMSNLRPNCILDETKFCREGCCLLLISNFKLLLDLLINDVHMIHIVNTQLRALDVMVAVLRHFSDDSFGQSPHCRQMIRFMECAYIGNDETVTNRADDVATHLIRCIPMNLLIEHCVDSFHDDGSCSVDTSLGRLCLIRIAVDRTRAIDREPYHAILDVLNKASTKKIDDRRCRACIVRIVFSLMFNHGNVTEMVPLLLNLVIIDPESISSVSNLLLHGLMMTTSIEFENITAVMVNTMFREQSHCRRLKQLTFFFNCRISVSQVHMEDICNSIETLDHSCMQHDDDGILFIQAMAGYCQQLPNAVNKRFGLMLFNNFISPVFSLFQSRANHVYCKAVVFLLKILIKNQSIPYQSIDVKGLLENCLMFAHGGVSEDESLWNDDYVKETCLLICQRLLLDNTGICSETTEQNLFEILDNGTEIVRTACSKVIEAYYMKVKLDTNALPVDS